MRSPTILAGLWYHNREYMRLVGDLLSPHVGAKTRLHTLKQYLASIPAATASLGRIRRSLAKTVETANARDPVGKGETQRLRQTTGPWCPPIVRGLSCSEFRTKTRILVSLANGFALMREGARDSGARY